MFPDIQNVEGVDDVPDSDADVLFYSEEHTKDVIAQEFVMTAQPGNNTLMSHLVSRLSEYQNLLAKLSLGRHEENFGAVRT